MQQQIFLQQMQMHMSAMEKHPDNSNKDIWRIAKFLNTHNYKVRRTGLMRRTMIAQVMASNYVTKA
jgi:hypothetical protein